MMRLSLKSLAVPALMFGLSVGSTGCIKQMLVDGQIEGTRKASSAFDTIGDYEMARAAAQAGLVQFEGMHKLSPNNEDALFMLVKGWTGFGFGFIEDEWEMALDAGDKDLAAYHQKRAKMAYDRAIFYGLELLGHKAQGFETAKKDDKSIRAWLLENFNDESDGGNLFWTGYAWLARVNVMKGDFEGAEYVAELYVAAAMLERSVALSPSYNHYAGQVALAAYHARMAMAELDQSKQMFEDALKKTEGKTLVVQLNYATRYACVKQDRALYETQLNAVLLAEDPDPEQRLTNAIAKRRAKRALSPQHIKECGMEHQPPVPMPQPKKAPVPAADD
jgi:TRAP transporter T-component